MGKQGFQDAYDDITRSITWIPVRLLDAREPESPYRHWTFSFNLFPALKRTTLEAGMEITSPVLGLRPSR